VVGLLSLRTALSGGAGRIVSAGALHNAILAERPDLLQVLYRGFHNSRRGHGEDTPSTRVPVFAQGARGLECYFLPQTIRQAMEEGYPLTASEEDALTFLGEVANRPDIIDFGAGDGTRTRDVQLGKLAFYH
jgi:Taurine catabolism dioxygenase TauD, TfdA family